MTLDDTEALCRSKTYDPDIWFAETEAGIAYAKSICRDCPLQTVCAQDAVRHDERWGVWGGLSPTDRGWKSGRTLAAA